MSTPLHSLSNFIHNWQEDNFKVQCKNCDKWFKCGKRNLANIKRHLSYVHGFEMGSAYDNKWDNKNRNPLLLSDEELFESQEMNEPEESESESEPEPEPEPEPELEPEPET